MYNKQLRDNDIYHYGIGNKDFGGVIDALLTVTASAPSPYVEQNSDL